MAVIAPFTFPFPISIIILPRISPPSLSFFFESSLLLPIFNFPTSPLFFRYLTSSLFSINNCVWTATCHHSPSAGAAQTARTHNREQKSGEGKCVDINWNKDLQLRKEQLSGGLEITPRLRWKTFAVPRSRWYLRVLENSPDSLDAARRWGEKEDMWHEKLNNKQRNKLIEYNFKKN